MIQGWAFVRTHCKTDAQKTVNEFERASDTDILGGISFRIAKNACLNGSNSCPILEENVFQTKTGIKFAKGFAVGRRSLEMIR